MIADKKKSIRLIEHHLRNYKTYKTGINNLQRQLDDIMPGITTTYELIEGSTGTFNIKSKTEQAVLDRMTGWRVIRLSEQKKEYETILSSIDESLKALGEQERRFVELRYIQGKEMESVSDKMNFHVQSCFRLRNQVMNKLMISLGNLTQV